MQLQPAQTGLRRGAKSGRENEDMTEATAGSNKIWPAEGRRNQIGDRCHLVGHSAVLPPATFYNKNR